jgi:hypothetical protein
VRRLFAFGVSLAVALAGCATTQEESDGPQACVVVDNSQGAGRQSQIFLLGEETGIREFVGEVGAGRVLRHCTRSSTLPAYMRLVIERPSNEAMDPARLDHRPLPIPSDIFLLSPWDLWTWDVDANRLSPQANGVRGGS